MIHLTKESVRYTDDHGSSEEQCSKCIYYVDRATCEVVIGTINPNGWCNQFHEAPSDLPPR